MDFAQDFNENDQLEEEFDNIEESWQEEISQESSQSSKLTETSVSASSYAQSQASQPMRAPELVEISYTRKAVEFWRSGKKKKINPESVMKHYPRLKNATDLYRWATQVDARGARLDKLRAINEMTLGKFTIARNNRLIVHDADLRRLAARANTEVKLEGFKASTIWLRNFKTAYRIGSR